MSFELYWQVSITDNAWELLPIVLKSNNHDGEAHWLWSQTLLYGKIVLLRCDYVHVVKQQPKEQVGGGEKNKEERW